MLRQAIIQAVMDKQDDLYKQPQVEESEDSEVQVEEQQQSTAAKKKFVPQEYHKAKRSVIKLVNDFFSKLKDEVNKGGQLHLNRNRLDSIQSAIISYVGLRYKDKGYQLDLVVSKSEQERVRPSRNGLFSYLSESDKIVNHTLTGQVNIISIEKGELKLPDIATPVPHDNKIYLLDCCWFNSVRRVFVPLSRAFKIDHQSRASQITPTLLARSKCALVKDKEWLYLLGGYVTENKILTNRCQRYNLSSQNSEEIQPMIHKHNCPSACMVANNIWVFSEQYLEYYDRCKWTNVSLPFGGRFLPFQYVQTINQRQVLVFGGMDGNTKSTDVKIYNTYDHTMTNYGAIMPQGLCNQRSWGPVIIDGSVAALASVQASVYPNVALKSSMSQVMYIMESSAYLKQIINA